MGKNFGKVFLYCARLGYTCRVMFFTAIRKHCALGLIGFLVAVTVSCSGRLGYGVLLWSADDPPVPSGTVLPVYVRSNLEHVWIAGIPDEFRGGDRIDKFEIPLSQLELAGSKSAATRRAEEFAPYALSYAETLQDGLPIRENPDNGARRVYRLKLGEIIKILAPAEGTVAVGTTGDPLPGEWFYVLTEDGNTGYCFSYRLRVFEHSGGVLAAQAEVETVAEDPDLDRLLSRVWSAEAYGSMVSNQRINLDELGQNWGFDPGQDTGIAVIKTKDVNLTFSYSAIRSTGSRSWHFEGASLQMELRSDNVLAVQYSENGGILRTVLFTALPTSVEDLVVQETARRDELFNVIFSQGPAFSSHNYGTITFAEDKTFTWTGNDLLIPQVIPASALGSGSADMRLFLGPAVSDRYGGAFTLKFNGMGSSGASVNFMYSLDNQGFRLEYIPDTSLDGVVVSRRSSSPLVLYFFKVEQQLSGGQPSSDKQPSSGGQTLPSGDVFGGENNINPEEL